MSEPTEEAMEAARSVVEVMGEVRASPERVIARALDAFAARAVAVAAVTAVNAHDDLVEALAKTTEEFEGMQMKYNERGEYLAAGSLLPSIMRNRAALAKAKGDTNGKDV